MTMNNGKYCVEIVVKDEFKHIGIAHSLEENSVPFEVRCSIDKFRELRFEGDGCNDLLEIIAYVDETSTVIYYKGYSVNEPVLCYDFAEWVDLKKELYLLERLVGNNISNVIKKKQIKELL